MSHSVDIKTQFKNLNNLLSQFEKAGWTIVTGAKLNTYPSDPRREEIHQYVAKNPQAGGYDVGVNVDAEGNTYFVCDFFGGSIERSLGENMKNVKQGYALDELRRFMEDEELNYKVDTLPTGELVVTAEA